VTKPARKRLGAGLLLLFVVIAVVSLLALRPTAVSAVFTPLLLPGFAIAAFLRGGNIHALESGEAEFWNIGFWALALAVPGIYCFLAGRSEPGDLPPIGGAS
jgi:hypothetical protein